MKEELFQKQRLPGLVKDKLSAWELSESVIERRIRDLRRLLHYMDNQGLASYNPDVGKIFLEKQDKDESVGKYTRSGSHTLVNVLDTIYNDLEYNRRKLYKDGHPLFGRIGDIASLFLEQLKGHERLSKTTIRSYRWHLSLFTESLCIQGVEVENLSETAILTYASSSQNTRPQTVRYVKRFLSYLFQEGFVDKDYSMLFDGVSVRRKEKIPSYYTKEEIVKLEKSVERSSAIGKRDYAIILLASRLGLRSSDIRNLQFSELDWDNSTINLIQYKTRRDLTLPLLADVGDAIIDYIRYGRPKSTLKTIFLTASAPYRKISAPGMSGIVAKHIYESGIEFKGKHKGVHTLRHSLATTMMNNGVRMPVISEVLGHAETQSTMHYLNIDVSHLLECSLRVPEVNSDFYNQGGGILYE